MKYKVGDKVRVRSDLDFKKSYWMEDRSKSNDVAIEMFELRGKVVTIDAFECEQYRIKGCGYYWTDEMFEGLAETEFHVYDTVKHEKYGLGTVIKVFKSNAVVDVDFDFVPYDRHGIKDNIMCCSTRDLTLVEAYTGGEAN